MTVTLEDAGCAWVVCVDGRRVATFVQWAHAMRFVEYLRTDRAGRVWTRCRRWAER